MPFDEVLASRVRVLVHDNPDVAERKMFGGLAFLLRGHMCCGIVGSDLMVRIGAGDYASALAETHVRPMDFTGRPSKAMVYVAPAGLRTESSLRRWVERGIRFSESLPAKAQPRGQSERRRL